MLTYLSCWKSCWSVRRTGGKYILKLDCQMVPLNWDLVNIYYRFPWTKNFFMSLFVTTGLKVLLFSAVKEDFDIQVEIDEPVLYLYELTEMIQLLNDYFLWLIYNWTCYVVRVLCVSSDRLCSAHLRCVRWFESVNECFQYVDLICDSENLHEVTELSRSWLDYFPSKVQYIYDSVKKSWLTLNSFNIYSARIVHMKAQELSIWSKWKC